MCGKNTKKGNMSTFEFSKDSIFNPELNLQMIINPVNIKGVSGAGLAKEFAKRFPGCQGEYEQICKAKVTTPSIRGNKKVRAFTTGELLHFIDVDFNRVVELEKSYEFNPDTMSPEEIQSNIDSFRSKVAELKQHIIYFPTKAHWKNPSKIEYISKGLDSLVRLLNTDEIKQSVKRVGIPALGCGLGGLSVDDVQYLITEKLSPLDYTFVMFYPFVPYTNED